ncbi:MULTISPECIES: ectoine hydroxylase [Acinetobacter]|uniref:Ectoine hydroxylase n=1 Tax=Acinetobacter haemolyticus CIP 64.3 = MTCC 9819 TaxID=1217659 RepID=N9GY59_ACIHA|nr:MULTISPECIES: ectoine hydroxylase [Acinetobacter]EEH67302.1 ectoine hydroxylase [Acinetobacter sp. ATCC 27244]ENW21964.1 ectoine hydroxylase [Acinetobacter haemolyticus CIP 64.3 = MTCC 9819]EPR88893.1 Ectoine hydroxylase [Acinetobacter haemolyticus CIP 64.3 = MTCC 9819]MQZ31808.1 ectoine hydroxylase [Acinetobacter haemolyticus]NAR50718.1 ectoine hydroxylase [Acinetobacter haemolyticus]
MQMSNPYLTRRSDAAAIISRADPVVYDSILVEGATAQQKQDYATNGFLQIDDLFSTDEVKYLLDELHQMRHAYAMQQRPEAIIERESQEVRSIFNVHRLNEVFKNLVSDERVLNIARSLLGSEVYIHQSRINYKPGLHGKEFFWHSDFETWHSEDGMPRMRALSCSILLTDNNEHNGPLLVIPGSHQHYISCQGETPDEHYKKSLKKQEYGVPDGSLLRYLADMGGIHSCTGRAGSVVFFDCNLMHGSNSNITPFSRSNIFFVYNSIDNQLQQPLGGLQPRPEFVAAREDIAPIKTKNLIL